MKYKAKFVLCSLIFIITIIGIVYSVSAANNLRALHDKYKASYNNFMKALKEGANQEQMDLLSAQCKTDYAEYQKELKFSNLATPGNSQVKNVNGNSVPEEKEDKNQLRAIESSIVKKPTDTCETLLMVQKNVTIMVNGKNRTVGIPYLNPEFIKKHPPIIQPENTGNIVLARIGGKKKGSKYYEVPVSYEQLGYPLDSNDEIRCEGEKKVYELYQLVTKVNSDTFGDLINNIYGVGFEIMEKYGKYPDICAAAQLYINDATIKYCKSSGYFEHLTSTTSAYFEYSQLASQYSHLKDSNKAVEAIINICEDRKNEIQANNKRLVDENVQWMKYIVQDKKELDKLMSPSYVYYGKPDEQVLKNHAENIKRLCNSICQRYNLIYLNYMRINDKNSADKILKIEKIGSEYVISGDLYKAYCIPYEKKLKYEYTVCLPNRDCPDYQTITGEETVKLFRDADCFLDIVNFIKGEQTLDKLDEIESDGRSRNERRTLDMCDYINDFKPSIGSAENNEAKEEITDEQLARRKKYAYAFGETEGYERFDFYKRKPYIKEMYITRNEDVRLSTYEIFLPHEYLTLRLKPDVSDYQNQHAPDYAFRCKVYTVKQTFDGTDVPPSTPPGPSLPSATALKGKAEPEVDRYKYVTILPDNLIYGFYGKFQINETDDTTQNLSHSSLHNLKKEEEGLESINLTLTGRDALKESISCIKNLYGPEEELKTMYLKNKYFNNINDKTKRNGLGYSNNYYQSEKHFMVANIDRQTILNGGFQLVYSQFKVTDPHHQAKLTICNPVRNQADWLIIDTHGDPDTTQKGAIIIAKPKDNDPNHDEKIFSVNPWELVDKINTTEAISQYDEDVDVLILLVCATLPWVDDKPNSDNPENFKYSKGWHKVLPKGIVLGFRRTTHDLLNRGLTMQLDYELGKMPNMDKEQTRKWLRDFWKRANERLYINYLNNQKVTIYENENGVTIKKVIDNPHKSAIGATVLDVNEHITYDEEDVIVTKDKYGVVITCKFKEVVKNFPN